MTDLLSANGNGKIPTVFSVTSVVASSFFSVNLPVKLCISLLVKYKSHWRKGLANKNEDYALLVATVHICKGCNTCCTN